MTPRFTRLAFLCVLLCGLAAPLAMAQDSTPPPAPTEQALPTDPIAPEEFSPGVDALPPVPAADAVLPADAHASEAHGEEHHEKVSPHPIWMLPFVIVLLSIALFPLFAQHWWEHNYPYVAGVLFVVGFLYYQFVRHDLHPWLHEMREYVSFIALLFALFVISGGIAINVSRKATPAANVLLLLIGAIIANLFGTTGAAMLLIRPYIRINRAHIKPYHIVFFIFIIANAGGCLTPIGDPPLFLGYLKGVPFWWVFEHCWQPWLVTNALLLAIFFVIDKLDHKKAERSEPADHDTGPAVRINGILNFVFILVVIGGVFRDSMFDNWAALSADDGVTGPKLLNLVFSREIIMVGAAIASKLATHKGIYEQNQFTYAPIREVAILFLAIFSTMKPALEYLDSNADKMPLETPGHFYFATGTLSAVLDNAPTYLTFLQARLGQIKPEQIDEIQRLTDEMYAAYAANPNTLLAQHIPTDASPDVRDALVATVYYHGDDLIEHKGHVNPDELKLAFLIGVRELNAYLVAISLGAVFFGAMTYIGNAPNFMVKSIAESSGIVMPSFLGYVFKYALPILLPVYVIVWAIFFLMGAH